MQQKALAVILALFSSTALANNGDWPKLIGAPKASECRAALSLARAAFRSNAFQPDPSQKPPAGFASKLVSGNQGARSPVLGDPDLFTQVALPDDANAFLSWQSRVTKGQRLVITPVRAGMHDAYQLLAIDAGMSTASYFARNNDVSTDPLPELFQTVLVVPHVFKTKNSGELWAIDGGPIYAALPAWQVFAQKATQYRLACEIQFRPDIGKGMMRFPQAVERLRVLLDLADGPPRPSGGGSYHDFFASALKLTWANAAMRPWSTPQATPSNRKQVERGLKKWARGHQEYKKLYQQIQAQLPLAERALATQYQTAFGMGDAKAQAKSHVWIDAIVRSTFYFPDESY